MTKACFATLASALVVSLFVSAGGAACNHDGPACYAGDYIACSCADGKRGYAACRVEDGLFIPCICDGTTPGLDGGHDADAALDATPEAGDGGTKKYFEACSANEECASLQCGSFGTRGTVCTISCTKIEECPAPADACTSKGQCRPPEK